MFAKPESACYSNNKIGVHIPWQVLWHNVYGSAVLSPIVKFVERVDSINE